MPEATGSAGAARKGPQCAYLWCQELAWASSPKDFCLYHAPENGKDDQTARQVWQEARRRAASGQCEFMKWHFPRDPDKKWFVDVAFVPGNGRGYANFEDAAFHDEALFDGSTFGADAHFVNTTFNGPASFDGVTYEGQPSYVRATFKARVSFLGTRFAGGGNFDKAVFEGPALFRDVTFGSDARFNKAIFRDELHFVFADVGGNAFFDRATFESHADFDHSTFRLGASFSYAGFKGPAQLQNVSFMSNTFFEGTAFGSEVTFRGSSFAPGVDISFDLPVAWPRPKARSFVQRQEGETAYRLAKEAARSRGDYRRAGHYHYAERCAFEHGRRRTCRWRPWRKEFWALGNLRSCVCSLFEFAFGRVLFGYGEKSLRVLLAGALVILCWAAAYYLLAGIGPPGLPDKAFLAYAADGWECLHFSVVTFTTLGYGDFQPKPACRCLADLEALIGAALMALFIVGLARKYTRG